LAICRWPFALFYREFRSDDKRNRTKKESGQNEEKIYLSPPIFCRFLIYFH